MSELPRCPCCMSQVLCKITLLYAFFLRKRYTYGTPGHGGMQDAAQVWEDGGVTDSLTPCFELGATYTGSQLVTMRHPRAKHVTSGPQVSPDKVSTS